jgi:hypothetical protein
MVAFQLRSFINPLNIFGDAANSFCYVLQIIFNTFPDVSKGLRHLQNLIAKFDGEILWGQYRHLYA